MKHIFERRINKAGMNPLPDIILIDGGKLQLEAALRAFSNQVKKPPMILSIVKGSKRIRSTETILSKDGIIEIPKDSSGFLLLQQIRDESHRFAIQNNRKKKKKSIKKSALDQIRGLGPIKKKRLLQKFKSIRAINQASIDELTSIKGINIKIAIEIQKIL